MKLQHKLRQICLCSVCDQNSQVDEENNRAVVIREAADSLPALGRLLFLVSEGRCPLCTSHVSLKQTPDRILKKYNAYAKTRMQRKNYA